MTPARTQAALAHAVVRALAEGDVLALQPLVSPHVIDRSAQPGQPAGWAGVRERAMALCTALPDSDVRVDVLSTQGDTVLARAELSAPARPGPGGPPTGPCRLVMVLVLRFADDLLVEMWTSSPGRPLDLFGAPRPPAPRLGATSAVR